MDIALHFDPIAFACDYAVAAGDLAADNGLKTAVLISLFTDRLAAADDEIPDGTEDRRGWWGDMPADGSAPPGAPPDPIGSRLWLLARAKQTPETLNRATTYCREALQWLLDDGIAQQLDVLCEFQGVGILAIRITIARLAPNGRKVDHRFDVLWNSTLAS